MVVMMTVMLLFGGLHLVHGEHRCGGDQPQKQAKQNQLDNGSQHRHGSDGPQTIVPAPEEAK